MNTELNKKANQYAERVCNGEFPITYSREQVVKHTANDFIAGWKEAIDNRTFFKMQHFPDKAKDETFSKTVLIFDENDNEFSDLGYYDFEKSEWVVFGGMSFKMICWCYLPNPSDFLQTKNYKYETHRGYC